MDPLLFRRPSLKPPQTGRRTGEAGASYKRKQQVVCWHLLQMSTPARRRLMRDFRRLQNDPPSGVTGAPMDNNILAWQVRCCLLFSLWRLVRSPLFFRKANLSFFGSVSRFKRAKTSHDTRVTPCLRVTRARRTHFSKSSVIPPSMRDSGHWQRQSCILVSPMRYLGCK